MPSRLHESLVDLFRNRPTFAAELIRDALHIDLPPFTSARIDSADLPELLPTEYRADLVVMPLDGDPVYGIVVEVQLQPDERKRFVWPAYVTNLRARSEVPVCLLVVAANAKVARWAAKPIDLGGGNTFKPAVLGPAAVPEVVDEAKAHADPELAVLSTIAHGKSRDTTLAARIAAAAREAAGKLDAKRSRLYLDLILSSLSKAAQRELRAMDPAKYEYQSEFAKKFVGVGRAEGRVELLQRLLTRRFGAVPPAAIERLSAATIDELDAIGERLLSAATLEDALGPQ
jgi:hypothetical protein